MKPRPARSAFAFAFGLTALGAVAGMAPVATLTMGGCRAIEPTNKPLDGCRRTCEKRAKRQCSDDECERGCEMILDRIIEREGDRVIACVARASRRCSDVVWAECAANVGAHADGGPPAPPPPPEDWE